jgi:hypothetical protein
MGQSFALIAEQQHDVANLGLRLEQLQTQPAAIDRLGVLRNDYVGGDDE